MKKFFYTILLTLLMANAAWAADTALSALAELAVAPAESDELYINDGGTSKKITVINLLNSLEAARTAFEIHADNLPANSPTATALAANGANCAAGSYPLGVDASGAVESCTDATTEIDSAIATALAGLSYQPLDAELTALAGLTSAANSIPIFTGVGTAGLIVAPANSQSLLAAADYAAMKELLNLEIGTDVQAQNATLQTIATAGDVPGLNVDIANTTVTADTADGDLLLIYDLTFSANRAITKGNFKTGIGAGSPVKFDIGDDGGDDSLDLVEIATTGDTNTIFTESAADKMLIAVGNNWPTADLAVVATALAANGANCAAGSYPLGVDASGAVESCTDATTEIDSAIATHAAVVIVPSLGGTGIANNDASTLTITGNFATTLTVSGITALTLPTSGTVTALGPTIGAAEVDADVATQVELNAVSALYDTADKLIAILNTTPTTFIDVAAGGTGIGAGTQYGLPYFSTTGQMASTAAGTTTTVLHGNAAGAPAFATITEADITLADNTTNNVSNVTHGFVPKATDTLTAFLRDDGTWAVPAGSGDVVGPAVSVDNTIPRFHLTTGKIIQASGVAIDDSDNMTGINSLTLLKTSGVAGALGHYEANSTDTTEVGWMGPTSVVDDLTWFYQFSSTKPTAGQAMVFGVPAGAGGPGGSLVSAQTWVLPVIQSAGNQTDIATSITSGGIVYGSSADTLSSTGALTQYGLIYAGGAGNPPAITDLGATGEVLTGNTGAAPTFETLLSMNTPSRGGTGVANNDASTLTITGAFPVNFTVGASASVNLSNLPAGVSTYVTPSATTIVPLGGDINTYIAAATAGDTLILSSGTYTITTEIAVNKEINIVGQGNAGLYSVVETDIHGTRIYTATDNLSMFNITADNVRIAHMSIISAGAGTDSKIIETATNLDGLTFTNLDMIMTSGAGIKTAIDIFGSHAIIRDCVINVISTNNTAYGVYVHNDATTDQDAIVDVHTTTVTTDGGSTRASAFYVYNNNDANTITMNVFSSWGKALTGTANDVAAFANSTTTNNAVLNIYQSTLDGADYDIEQSGTNSTSIYGGILVNDSSNGTITYGGTVAASVFTGTIDTATALAANGADCAAGSYPLGVDASGAAESCTDATTEIDSAIATHVATVDVEMLIDVTGEGTAATYSLFDNNDGTYSFRAIAAGDLPATLSSGTAITNAALTTPAIGAATGISLYVTGHVQAPMEVTAPEASKTVATADLNTVRISSAAGDWDLPADSCDAATGNWLTVVANAAHVASITSLDTSDVFVLSDGTALTADDELDTGGSAWDSCTVLCVAANTWLVVGERGTCADGGVAD